MPMVSKALSEGLGDEIELIMSRPNRPMEITTEKSLWIYLNMLVPQYRQWGTIKGSRSVEFLFKEFKERDCRLFVIDWKGIQFILRDIKTATLYVTANQQMPHGVTPSVKKLWLREYHLDEDEGVMVPRRYENSMSEKRTLDEPSFLHAAIRALRKELSIDPRPEHFMPPYLFSMSEYPDIRGKWSPALALAPIESVTPSHPDVRDTPRYPGILTRNELEHFMWLMPDEFFVSEGYHELNTNHYFEWEELVKSVS